MNDQRTQNPRVLGPVPTAGGIRFQKLSITGHTGWCMIAWYANNFTNRSTCCIISGLFEISGANAFDIHPKCPVLRSKRSARESRKYWAKALSATNKARLPRCSYSNQHLKTLSKLLVQQLSQTFARPTERGKYTCVYFRWYARICAYTCA